LEEVGEGRVDGGKLRCKGRDGGFLVMDSVEKRLRKERRPRQRDRVSSCAFLLALLRTRMDRKTYVDQRTPQEHRLELIIMPAATSELVPVGKHASSDPKPMRHLSLHARPAQPVRLLSRQVRSPRLLPDTASNDVSDNSVRLLPVAAPRDDLPRQPGRPSSPSDKRARLASSSRRGHVLDGTPHAVLPTERARLNGRARRHAPERRRMRPVLLLLLLLAPDADAPVRVRSRKVGHSRSSRSGRVQR
jgi:hypothetical protein